MIAKNAVFCAALIVASAGSALAKNNYPLPSTNIEVVGLASSVETVFEDTFVSLGRQYGLGYEELVAANPAIDPWLPGEKMPLLLPGLFVLPDAPRNGLVLNLAEMRMYYFTADEEQSLMVQTWPVSVGSFDTDTPTGSTTIVDKARDPVWYPPASIIKEHAERGEVLPRTVPPGPDNPLGRFALQLGIRGYLIHGTNKPAGIGMRVTHGCIRMQNEDIEALFSQVGKGTAVHIINQPYKLGWVGEQLFLEVHKPFADDTTHLDRGMTAIVELLVRKTAERNPQVDWDAVTTAFEEAKGVPVPITLVAARDLQLGGWCSSSKTSEHCEKE